MFNKIKVLNITKLKKWPVSIYQDGSPVRNRDVDFTIKDLKFPFFIKKVQLNLYSINKK